MASKLTESRLKEGWMSLAFHWFLPTYGDSRNLVAGGHGTAMQGDRPATLRYLRQICAAAEDNGFEAVLTPTGLWCEDAWLTTAMWRVVAVSSSVMARPRTTLAPMVSKKPGVTRAQPALVSSLGSGSGRPRARRSRLAGPAVATSVVPMAPAAAGGPAFVAARFEMSHAMHLRFSPVVEIYR